MKTVFFDVDTQIDFLYPAGALYVPRAERLVDAVAQLNQHAASRGIPVVSAMDAHRENEAEFRDWPSHCVAGTAGQQKPARTLLDPRITISTTPGDYEIAGARQIIVEKQQIDPFTNPNLPQLLDRLGADRYVVYGVVTEYCVRCAALGLARLGKPVEIVGDAICGLQDAEARRTLDEVAAAGGRLTTIADVCGRE
jgi:nicotinamidase/pyrazinamidase